MNNEIIMYTTEDGLSEFSLRELDGELWLSQKDIAELYQTTVSNINKHIKAICAENELDAQATIEYYSIVQNENGREVQRKIAHYSLAMIIAIGYRVRSTRGTQFRQWATRTLGEYINKGFVLNDDRLKNPPVGASRADDQFEQLIKRIRDIRSSERRMYLRVREIFALAADYQPSLAQTTQFFQIIQNKLHYACTHKTAPELIYHRANANLPNMGLTAWRGKEVVKADVTVAKNYLDETEIDMLNRIVSMWLDFAEDQATRKKQVFLQDWADKLDAFLSFNDRDILPNAGNISREQARQKAELEYEKFAAQRRLQKEQDGERYIAELLRLKEK